MSKLPKIDIIKINIGDSIYRYVSFGGIREFKVVGKRWYEDNIQLEVEDQHCNHGWNCRLLVAMNDYGRLISIKMLNDDEDDSQRHWHSQEDYNFWLDKKHVRQQYASITLSGYRDKLAVAENNVKEIKKVIDELEVMMDCGESK